MSTMLSICSRIVVPYDGSIQSTKALDTAVSFLRQEEKIELDVIRVVNMRDVVHHNGLSLVDIEEMREKELSVVKKALQEIEDALKLLPNKTRIIVLEGDPAKTICHYIKKNKTDLIVMGSRGLSGIQEMLMGSVSHHIVQKSSCPVLIIK